jgi:hypothetical protein
MTFKYPSIVLLCAFRYALGRKTYVVSMIVDELVTNWNELSYHDKDKIQNEILSASDLGMECDRQEWERILKLPL